MLSFGCAECCASAVVGHGGRRLAAFEPFKRRIFVVILYWTLSQRLPLNPIRTLLYIYISVLSSKLDLVIFPNHIPYSAESSSLVVLLHRFLSNRAHLKHLVSTLSASCCYCSNQRPVVGLVNQPGYTNHVPVDGQLSWLAKPTTGRWLLI